MKAKWYELTCDNCRTAINHYLNHRPTRAMLKEDGVICIDNHHFCCTECWAEWYQLQRSLLTPL